MGHHAISSNYGVGSASTGSSRQLTCPTCGEEFWSEFSGRRAIWRCPQQTSHTNDTKIVEGTDTGRVYCSDECATIAAEKLSGTGAICTNTVRCSQCNGKGSYERFVSCNDCSGLGKIDCNNCEGRGYLLYPYSCTHGRSGGSSHYYCSSSSNHGNIVNQYH